MALIADLRKLPKKVGLFKFQRQLPTDGHPDDAESIILGHYPESQRKFPLRTP